jgi:low affinity Fe/Cu permease
MSDEDSTVEDLFANVAAKASQGAGSFWAFAGALLIILVWAATGPIFGFSEVWQLVINTGTTIITFLMVFIIQHAQNKEMRAVQLKLNELIAAVEGASNRLIDVEDLSDREVEVLYQRFRRLAKSAEKVSNGAKLTIDRDSDCTDGPCSDSASKQGSRKTRPSIKSEAQGRKRQAAGPRATAAELARGRS